MDIIDAQAKAKRTTHKNTRNIFRVSSVTGGNPKCACGRRLRGRADGRHCSDACRQRAYRKRKKPNPDNEWYTPKWLVELVRDAMGGSITLDPASCPVAQAVVKAKVFYTVRDDGLKQPWLGNIYLNAPFVPSGQKFIEKLLEEFDAGRVEQAIVLVNAATSAGWFQKLLKRFPCCFVNKRIRFWRRDRRSTSPTRGQAIFYLGPKVKRFGSKFGKIGTLSMSR